MQVFEADRLPADGALLEAFGRTRWTPPGMTGRSVRGLARLGLVAVGAAALVVVPFLVAGQGAGALVALRPPASASRPAATSASLDPAGPAAAVAPVATDTTSSTDPSSTDPTSTDPSSTDPTLTQPTSEPTDGAAGAPGGKDAPASGNDPGASRSSSGSHRAGPATTGPSGVTGAPAAGGQGKAASSSGGPAMSSTSSHSSAAAASSSAAAASSSSAAAASSSSAAAAAAASSSSAAAAAAASSSSAAAAAASSSSAAAAAAAAFWLAPDNLSRAGIGSGVSVSSVGQGAAVTAIISDSDPSDYAMLRAIGGASTVTLESQGGTTWAIRSASNGKYWCAETGYADAGYAVVRARSTSVASCEKFRLYHYSDGTYAIQATINGLYLFVNTPSGTTYTGKYSYMIRAAASAVGPYARFRLS